MAFANVTGGAPTDATYLVVNGHASLANERRLQASNGIQLVDGGANNEMSISVVVETDGGIRLVNGGLAVKIADFTGFGLQDDGSGNIRINTALLVGTGLVQEGDALAVDFSEVARTSNEITVNAGDGLALGGTVSIGEASSTINLEVESTDIQGLGLSLSLIHI